MAVEFNEEQQALFNEKLKEKQEQWKRKYENYLSPDDVKAQHTELNKQISDLTKALDDANKQIETFNADITERDKKIKSFENHSIKTRIAHEVGLGYEAIDFLKGDDEDAIRTSAEALKNWRGNNSVVPPVVKEPKIKDDPSKEAYGNLVKNLKKEV